MAMKLHPKRKTMVSCAFALILLVTSFASFATGASVRGGDDVFTSIKSTRKDSNGSIQYSLSNKQLDATYLLQHAIKVNTNHLRTRKLEDAVDEDGGEEGNGEDGDGDNAEEQENEGENAEGGDQDADEQDADEQDADEQDAEEQDAEEQDAEEQDAEEQDADEQDANEQDANEQNADEQDADEGNGDEAEEQQNGQDDNNAEEQDEENEEVNNDDQQEADDEEGDEDDEAVDDQGDEEEEEEVAYEDDDDEEPQVNFLKCAAFTVEPNIMDVSEMVQNGEINEDEATEIENTYITEMTSKLNTQESVVFFTYGNGRNDENQELYMVSIDDWITASYGYDQVCHAIDQDDVDYIFSKIPSFSSVKKYSEHKWYSGFNCNSDGSGLKTHLFLDNNCKTFSPTINEYYPFKSTTNENRANQDYSTRVSSDLTRYMTQNVNNVIENSQYCEESKFCEKVFENSVEATTCEGNDKNRYRKLASYQIENEVASSIQDACPSIQTALGMDDEYEYSSYEMKEVLLLWSNVEDGGQEPDRKQQQDILGSNYLWLYLAGLLAVGSITAYCLCRTKRKQKYRVDTDDSGYKARKEPLVDKSGVRRSESDIVEDLSAIECTVSEKRSRRKSSRSKTRESRSKSRSRRIRKFREKIGLSGNDADTEEP